MDNLQAVRRMRACLGRDSWNMGLTFVERQFWYQPTRNLTHLLPNVPSIESGLLQAVAAAGALRARRTSGQRMGIAPGPSRAGRSAQLKKRSVL